MRVVFVSGPYRASSEHGVYLNIHASSELALQIWKAGAACVSPQKNTAFFGGAADDALWLEGDKEILKRCDAVFAAPGWRHSEGAQQEIMLAKQLDMPVFEDIPSLKNWLSEERASK